MAIDIIGAEGSPEWDAACEFSDMLASLLHLTDAATIVSGAKCWGQGKVDLDLVVLGTMAKGFVIEPKAIPADLRDRTAHLASFALRYLLRARTLRASSRVSKRCCRTGETALVAPRESAHAVTTVW